MVTLDARFSMLRGLIRDHVTRQGRAFVRFFGCEQELIHELPDIPLPDPVASAAEPYFVVRAPACSTPLALLRCPSVDEAELDRRTLGPPGWPLQA
jgi:hypothetical protein